MGQKSALGGSSFGGGGSCFAGVHFCPVPYVKKNTLVVKTDIFPMKKLFFRSELEEPSQIDTETQLEYSSADHCMHCYLGQTHTCHDPEWLKDYTVSIRIL